MQTRRHVIAFSLEMRHGPLRGSLNEGTPWRVAKVRAQATASGPADSFESGLSDRARTCDRHHLAPSREDRRLTPAKSTMSVDDCVPWQRQEWGENEAEHVFLATVISEGVGAGAVASHRRVTELTRSVWTLEKRRRRRTHQRAYIVAGPAKAEIGGSSRCGIA